jgi:hypothetical protein
VVDVFGSALLGELVVFVQETRQLERLQVMDEQKRREEGRDRPWPMSSPR